MHIEITLENGIIKIICTTGYSINWYTEKQSR